jgi:amino acid transporter
MSYIKSLFVLKNAPNTSEIKVSEIAHKKATKLLCLGLLILFASVIGGLIKALFFSGLKVTVNELNFPILLLSIIATLILGGLSLIKLNNAHTDILNNTSEEKHKVVLGAIGPLLLSVYLSFLTINEARLAGQYNEDAHHNICKVYLSSGDKSNSCINYENEMAIDKSLIARALYFYDFKY